MMSVYGAAVRCRHPSTPAARGVALRVGCVKAVWRRVNIEEVD